MLVGTTVHFRDVSVVAESELALCCRITGRNYWLDHAHLLEGSTVAHFGDHGIIVLTSQFAEERGLLLGRGAPLL